MYIPADVDNDANDTLVPTFRPSSSFAGKFVRPTIAPTIMDLSKDIPIMPKPPEYKVRSVSHLRKRTFYFRRRLDE